MVPKSTCKLWKGAAVHRYTVHALRAFKFPTQPNGQYRHGKVLAVVVNPILIQQGLESCGGHSYCCSNLQDVQS